MRSMRHIGVSGIIFTAPPMNSADAVSLSQSIPIVIINNDREGTPLDTIVIDDFRVGELVAEHLLARDFRRGDTIQVRKSGAKLDFVRKDKEKAKEKAVSKTTEA